MGLYGAGEACAVASAITEAAIAAIQRASDAGEKIDWIAGNEATTRWGLFENLPATGSATKGAQLIAPPTYYGSTFLNSENLLNILNQVALIAIIAIGMTMVIIVGGIDLSVGSIVALSAVLTARAIRDFAGGASAGPAGLFACCLGGVLLCATVGALTLRPNLINVVPNRAVFAVVPCEHICMAGALLEKVLRGLELPQRAPDPDTKVPMRPPSATSSPLIAA